VNPYEQTHSPGSTDRSFHLSLGLFFLHNSYPRKFLSKGTPEHSTKRECKQQQLAFLN
ncbi:Hypothetical protein FKW44_009208, partial [Caligus rogercresseyi]